LAAASALGGALGHPEGAALVRDPEGAAAWRARIAADPVDVTAHVELSKLLIRAKQPVAAMAHLWPAVLAAPQEASGPIRFQLALALALQGQYDVAEPLLEQVLQLDPGFVEGRICLCNVLEARGQLGRAVAALEEVRALRPDLEAWCAREIGRLLRQQAGGGAGAST
jgi:tetratricopeptide (TPR) repeat protein